MEVMAPNTPDEAMLDLALSYAAQGWPVFPCRNADYYDENTGEVYSEKSPLVSNGFKGATINERVIRELWKRNPSALVGVPTGERSGFWVLDVDVPPKHEDGRPWLAAMEAEHGPLSTRQAETGSGGLHFLFAHEHGIRNADVATGVESRGEGGYFIAPGSVMEDGRTYQWLNDNPIAPAPAWLLKMLIKPKHVYEPQPERGLEDAGASEVDELLSYISPDCSYTEWVSVLMAVHSALGSEGLAIADSWSARGQKYRQGEVAKKWKGFSSTGGVNIASLADLARQGGANLSEISRRHRPFQDNDNTPPVDVSRLVANALRKAQEASAPAIEPTELSEDVVLAHAATPDEEPKVAIFKTPDALNNVPGLVGDIANWLTETARNPAPILNLGAALTYVGALAGRRYEGPTGLRTNVYVVGLAPSGFGKEHPRAGIKSLAGASQTLSKFFGGNKIASSSGLRNRVKANPTLVYMIDEFGGFMRKVTSPKSGNHEKEIAEDLLEMTGTAASVFMGADYAQNLAEPIYNPNVCIFGTSTPDAFWKALGSGSIMDGFLPRFIVLDAGNERPKPRDPKSKVSQPPKDLQDKVQALVVHRNGGNLNGMIADGSRSITPIQVAWGRGAKRVFDDFVTEMFGVMDNALSDHEPVYARVAENAMRIATIVAIGVDPERPEVTAETMRWAVEIARRSCQMLLEQAERYVADNDRQAEYKRVRAIIGEGKRSGMRRSYLVKRLNGVIDRRRLDDIVNMLIDAEEVVDVIVTPPNGGKKSSVLYLFKYAPSPEMKAA